MKNKLLVVLISICLLLSTIGSCLVIRDHVCVTIVTLPTTVSTTVPAVQPVVQPTAVTTSAIPQTNLYKVTRVVDGDTIVVDIDGVSTKVRLIGIDCPESVAPYDYDKKNSQTGTYASEFTSSQLEGQYVSLEYDVEKTDCYGRTLAYVYLNGVMFNKTLLEHSYATVDTFLPNDKYAKEFEAIANN